jgi:hypothetical protein
MRPAASVLAAAALLVVGGAAGAALTAQPDRAAVAAGPAPPAPVEVRTQVIHRTVHVVRHIKPKKHPAAAPPAPAPAVVTARPQPAVASVARPAPRVVRPLRTHSSGTGGGRGEREDGGEHEGGEDD